VPSWAYPKTIVREVLEDEFGCDVRDEEPGEREGEGVITISRVGALFVSSLYVQQHEVLRPEIETVAAGLALEVDQVFAALDRANTY